MDNKETLLEFLCIPANIRQQTDPREKFDSPMAPNEFIIETQPIDTVKVELEPILNDGSGEAVDDFESGMEMVMDMEMETNRRMKNGR